MKLRSSKTLLTFIAIIAFAGLSACATDAVEDVSDTGSGVDATAEDTRAPEDTRSPQDTDETEDTGAPQEDTSDTADAADPDASADPDAVEVPDAQSDAQEDVEEPIASGQTCDTAIDATAGGLWDDRSTLDAGDNYNAPFSGEGCPAGQYTEGDEVFVLSPDVDTTYTVLVTPLDPTFKPIVYIRDDCSVDTCLYGSKMTNSSGAIGLSEVEVPGGEDYFIIVDTESNEGPYTMEVTIN